MTTETMERRGAPNTIIFLDQYNFLLHNSKNLFSQIQVSTALTPSSKKFL